MKKYIVVGVLIILLIIFADNTMAEINISEIEGLKYQFKRVVSNPQIRNDNAGSGTFEASRGNRKHNGIDILVNKGELIYAPFNCKIIRVAYPYNNNITQKGFLIKGLGLFKNVELKIFYAELIVNIGSEENAGTPIAKAQAISEKYPNQGMKDHIHIEMYVSGKLINPTDYFIK